MAKIMYQNEVAVEEADLGLALLQISLKHDIPHIHACGGNARCSTCRVMVHDGLENVLPRNDLEQRLACKKGLEDNVRLACQSAVIGLGREGAAVRGFLLDGASVRSCCTMTAGEPRKGAGMTSLMFHIASSGAKQWVEAVDARVVWPRTAAPSRESLVAELEDVTAAAAIVISSQDALWERVQDVLSRGVEGGAFRKVLLELDGQWSRIQESFAHLGRSVSALELKDQLEDLDSLAGRLDALRQGLAAVLACIRPEPPEGFLERAEKAMAENKGVYFSSEEVLAGLKNE